MKKIYFLLPLAAMLLAGCNGGGEESHATGLSTSGDASVPSETSSGEASTGEASSSQEEISGDDISTGLGFVLGGHAYALTDNIDDGKQENRTGRYLVENLDLVADTEFYFTKDGALITKIGGNGDDKTGGFYNNWLYGSVKGKYKVAVTSSGASMELSTWEDGGCSFWSPVTTVIESHGTEPGEGGEGGGTPVDVDNVTFTITECPDWTNKDGIKVFAWTWGGASADKDGKWRLVTMDPAEYVEGTKITITLEAPEDSTGMLLVRCHEDTVEPDWTIRDANVHKAGRIYNKTSDITITAGVTSYTCPDFVGYPN